MKSNAFGLDIGTTSFKLVYLSRENNIFEYNAAVGPDINNIRVGRINGKGGARQGVAGHVASHSPSRAAIGRLENTSGIRAHVQNPRIRRRDGHHRHPS